MSLPDLELLPTKEDMAAKDAEIVELEQEVEELKTALRELILIVKHHSEVTDNNFAWAEIQICEELL